MSKEKEITIKDLALMMKEGFANAEKHTDAKIEDLARMIEENTAKKSDLEHLAMKSDIERLEKKMDEKFEKVDERLENLEHKGNQIDRRLFSIEEDVAEIKTKKHNELEKRVTVIERKIGIKAAA